MRPSPLAPLLQVDSTITPQRPQRTQWSQAALQLPADLALFAQQQDGGAHDLLLRVLLADPLAVGTALHIGDPLRVVQVPLHGFGNAGVKGFCRLPAQFTFNLVRIDGVAAIVAGAVGDVGDLFGVAAAIGTRAQLVQQTADGVHDVDIGLFVPAADVVGFTQLAGLQYAADGAAVVLDVEPVTHLHAIAVNRQRLAGQGVDDHERNQLFRKVVGAVVVAAVGGEHRQAVGVVVGAYQMVAGGLAGAVGAVGLVTVLLGKGRGIRCQGAVDLVGGDVQEAEGLLGLALQAVVVGAGAFQQVKGADDIGLDKVFRAVDGAVHMAFGGKVEDGAWLVLGQQTADQLGIADIALHEEVARVVLHCGQSFEVAGVGQLVQVEDGLVVLRQPVENEVAADEAGAACDEDHGAPDGFTVSP